MIGSSILHQIVVCINFSQNLCLRIVAPKKLRTDIMSLAHDPPLAGQLGNKKTRERIMQNFFWPGMYIVVSRCKPCSICQKGTQKRKTSKANSGHWCYIFQFYQWRKFLVFIDHKTRFLEAFSMINQRVGFSKEILSDQGANICPYIRVLQNV